ncbi:MAG: DUF4013 domain-containing protein [Raoultibacter sp.]
MQTMQAGYFKTAWGDIKSSPGWVGKLLLLALVGLVPVFGPIVIAGYLYGWARDTAWGVHKPLPQHLFGNEDGKLYSRGFFVCVLGVVCSLIPFFVQIFFDTLTGTSNAFYGEDFHHAVMPFMPFSGIFLTISVIFSLLLSVAASFFLWIGSMRISIYDRLSAGFQFNKVWAMFRQDSNGLVRIFGMNLVVGLICGTVACAICFFVVFVGAFLGVFFIEMPGGSFAGGLSGLDASAMGFALALLVGGIVLALIFGYLVMVAILFVEMLTARALGYWTYQFNVPAWHGQDDPMPFERQQPQQPYYATTSPVEPVTINQAQPESTRANQEASTVPGVVSEQAVSLSELDVAGHDETSETRESAVENASEDALSHEESSERH